MKIHRKTLHENIEHEMAKNHEFLGCGSQRGRDGDRERQRNSETWEGSGGGRN